MFSFKSPVDILTGTSVEARQTTICRRATPEEGATFPLTSSQPRNVHGHGWVTQRSIALMGILLSIVGLSTVASTAAAEEISSSQTRTVVASEGVSLDGFTLVGARTVLSVSNEDLASISTPYLTRIVNGVFGAMGAPDDEQALMFQGDSTEGVGRAPWTIEVAAITFATPNGRIGFRGHFPKGSQITVRGLSSVPLPGGEQPLLPQSRDSAFVVLDNVRLSGASSMRFAGLDLLRGRRCNLSAPFVHIASLVMEGASSLVIGGETALGVVDMAGQRSTCTPMVAAVNRFDAIRVDSLALSGESHFAVEDAALTQTATTFDYTAFVGISSLRSTGGSGVSVLRTAYTVGPSPSPGGDEVPFENAENDYLPHSMLLAIVAAPDAPLPSWRTEQTTVMGEPAALWLSDDANVTVRENTFLDHSCVVRSPSWPEGVPKGRLNFFFVANVNTPTITRGVRIAVEENFGDAKCAAFGAVVSIEDEDYNNYYSYYGSSEDEAKVSNFSLRIAANNATNFLASYSHKTNAISDVFVSIVDNFATWGRAFSLSDGLEREAFSIYAEDWARIAVNISGNTIAFVRDEHYSPLHAAPLQIFAISNHERPRGGDSLRFLINGNTVTYPRAAPDRSDRSVFVNRRAAFSLEFSELYRSEVIVEANVVRPAEDNGEGNGVDDGRLQMDNSVFFYGVHIDIEVMAEGSFLAVRGNTLNGAAEVGVAWRPYYEFLEVLAASTVVIADNVIATYGPCPPSSYVYNYVDGTSYYNDGIGAEVAGGVWIVSGGIDMDGANISVVRNSVTVAYSRVLVHEAYPRYDPPRILGAVLETKYLLALRSRVEIEVNAVAVTVGGGPRIGSMVAVGLTMPTDLRVPSHRSFAVLGAGGARRGRAEAHAINGTALPSKASASKRARSKGTARRAAMMKAQQSSGNSMCSPLTRSAEAYAEEFYDDHQYTQDPGAFFEASEVRIERNIIDVSISDQQSDTFQWGEMRGVHFIFVSAQAGRTLLSKGSQIVASGNNAKGTIERPLPADEESIPRDLDSFNMVAVLLPAKLLARGGSALTATHNTFSGRSSALLGTFTGVQLGLAQSAFCHTAYPYNPHDFNDNSVIDSYMYFRDWEWRDAYGPWGICHTASSQPAPSGRSLAAAAVPSIGEAGPIAARRIRPASYYYYDDDDYYYYYGNDDYYYYGNDDYYYYGNDDYYYYGNDDDDYYYGGGFPCDEEDDLGFGGGYEGAPRTDIAALLGEDPLFDGSRSYRLNSDLRGLLFVETLYITGSSTVRIDGNAFDHHFVSVAGEEAHRNLAITSGDLLRCQERLVFFGGDHLKLFVSGASLLSISHNTFGRRDEHTGALRPSAPTAASYLGISLEVGQVLSVTNGSTFAVDGNAHAVAVRIYQQRSGGEEGEEEEEYIFEPNCFATLQGAALNFSVVIVEAHSRVSLSGNSLEASSDAAAVGRAKGFVFAGQCDVLVVYSGAPQWESDITLLAMFLVRYNSTFAVDANAFSYVFAATSGDVEVPADMMTLLGAVGAAVLAPWAVALVMADARLSVSANVITIDVPTRNAAHPVGAGILSAGNLVTTRSEAAVEGNTVTITLADAEGFDVGALYYYSHLIDPIDDSNTATGVFLCAHPYGRLPAIYDASATNISGNTIAINTVGNAYGVRAVTCDVLGMSEGGSFDGNSPIGRTYDDFESCEDKCGDGWGFVSQPWGYDYCDGEADCTPNAYLCDYTFHKCDRLPPTYFYYSYGQFVRCRNGQSDYGGCSPEWYKGPDRQYHRCRFGGDFEVGVTRCVDECDGADADCLYAEGTDGAWRNCYAEGENCEPTHYVCEGGYHRCRLPDHLGCSYYDYIGGDFVCCKHSTVVGGEFHGGRCTPQYYDVGGRGVYAYCDGMCVDQCGGKDTLCDHTYSRNEYEYKWCDMNPYAAGCSMRSGGPTYFACDGWYSECKGPRRRECKFYYYGPVGGNSNLYEYQCCTDNTMYYLGNSYQCEAHYYFDEDSGWYARCQDGSTDTVCTDTCYGSPVECNYDYYYDYATLCSYGDDCPDGPHYYECPASSGPISTKPWLHPCRGPNGALPSSNLFSIASGGEKSSGESRPRKNTVERALAAAAAEPSDRRESLPFVGAAEESEALLPPSAPTAPSLQSLVSPFFNDLVLGVWFHGGWPPRELPLIGGLPMASSRTELDGESIFGADGNDVRMAAIGERVIGVDLHAGWAEPNTFFAQWEGYDDGALALLGSSTVSIRRNTVDISHAHTSPTAGEYYGRPPSDEMIYEDVSPYEAFYGISAPHVSSLHGGSAVRIDGNTVKQTTIPIGLQRPNECDNDDTVKGADLEPSQIILRGRRMVLAEGSAYSVDGNTLRQTTSFVSGLWGALGAVLLDSGSSFSFSRNKLTAERSSGAVAAMDVLLAGFSLHQASSASFSDNAVEVHTCADVASFIGIRIGFDGAALVGGSSFAMERNTVLWEYARGDLGRYPQGRIEGVVMMGAGVKPFGIERSLNGGVGCTRVLLVNETDGTVSWESTREYRGDGRAYLWGPSEATVIASGSVATMVDNSVTARPSGRDPAEEGFPYLQEGVAAFYFLASEDSIVLMLSDLSALLLPDGTLSDSPPTAEVPRLSIERNVGSLRFALGESDLVALITTPTAAYCEGPITIAGNDVSFTKGLTATGVDDEEWFSYAIMDSFGILLSDVTDRTGAALTVAGNMLTFPIASRDSIGVYVGLCTERSPTVLTVEANTALMTEYVSYGSGWRTEMVGIKALLRADTNVTPSGPHAVAPIAVVASRNAVSVVTSEGDEAAPIPFPALMYGILIELELDGSSGDGTVPTNEGGSVPATVDASHSRVRLPPREQSSYEATTAYGVSLNRWGYFGGVPLRYTVDGADVRIADGIGVAVFGGGNWDGEARDTISAANVNIDVLCMGRSDEYDGCRGIDFVSDGAFPYSHVTVAASAIVVRVAGLQYPPRHLHAILAGTINDEWSAWSDGLNLTITDSRIVLVGDVGEGAHWSPDSNTVLASPIRLHVGEIEGGAIEIHRNTFQLDLRGGALSTSLFGAASSFVAIAANEGEKVNFTGTVALTFNHFDSPLFTATVPPPVYPVEVVRALSVASSDPPTIGTVDIDDSGARRSPQEQTNLTFVTLFDPSGTVYSSFAECNLQQGEDMYDWPNKYNDTVDVFRGFRWDVALPCEVPTTTEPTTNMTTTEAATNVSTTTEETTAAEITNATTETAEATTAEPTTNSTGTEPTTVETTAEATSTSTEAATTNSTAADPTNFTGTSTEATSVSTAAETTTTTPGTNTTNTASSRSSSSTATTAYAATVPPTCAARAAAEGLAAVPLFNEAAAIDTDVANGAVLNVSLAAAMSQRIHTLFVGGRSDTEEGDVYSIVCSPRHRSLHSIGGNSRGFAHALPTGATLRPASMTVLNSAGDNLTSHHEWVLALTPLPDYAIEEEEALDLFLPESALVGAVCGGSALVRIGTVRVAPSGSVAEGAKDATTSVSVVGTVAATIFGAAGLAAEQQGLSAIAMMTCTDPHTQGAFGSYRALSPFALWDSYIGVVAGNFAFIAAVFLIQGAVLLILRLAKRVRRWEELSALARFPAVLLNCSFVIHTGTAYAASQLITLDDRPIEDRVVGGLAFAFIILYPFGLVGFAYKFVGRAYQSYSMADYLEERQWPGWVTHLLPQGAIYAPETRRTFGSLVSSYRLSGLHWPSYPTWTPLIFAIGGLFHPDTIPKCQALFVCMGLAFVALCVLVLVLKPKRSGASNWVDSVARALSAMVLFCMAIAIVPGDDGRNAALAALAFGFIQTALTIIRALYAISLAYFDRRLQQLPLTHEWVHYTSDGAKTAKRFGASEELFDDLHAEAQRRDGGDVDIGDFGDEKNNGTSAIELRSRPVLPAPESAAKASGLASESGSSSANRSSGPPSGSAPSEAVGKEGHADSFSTDSSRSDGERQQEAVRSPPSSSSFGSSMSSSQTPPSAVIDISDESI